MSWELFSKGHTHTKVQHLLAVGPLEPCRTTLLIDHELMTPVQIKQAITWHAVRSELQGSSLLEVRVIGSRVPRTGDAGSGGGDGVGLPHLPCLFGVHDWAQLSSSVSCDVLQPWDWHCH